jgi:poly-gamma-glutamate capsule biosynthesis protein CapA/YwtB (metallophosphatase superfamily)
MNITINKTIKKIAVVVIITAIFTVIYYLLWRQGCFLPDWINWHERNIETTVNGTDYNITLNKNKTVTVALQNEPQEKNIIWTTDSQIKTQDVLSCDIDGDSEDELVLLCWKRGRYGKARPFWVTDDEKVWTQHLFVYEYGGEEISPKWMSSYLGFDVKEMSSELLNSTYSTKQRLVFTDTDDVLNLFVWSSWGFEKEESSVSFSVFGDNLIHEPIYRYGLSNDKNFTFLYKNVKEIINKSDISIINQETPLVDKPSLYSGYPLFGTPINVGEAIVNAGFDIVTCATNHALDKGMYGIDTTKNFFAQNNITCLGIQTTEETEYVPYELITKHHIKIALLNYTYGTNGIKMPEENKYAVHLLKDENQIKADIKAAREAADIVIIFPHWGTENSTEIDTTQEKWTDIFLEGGADVVVGTHPHALQPYEILTSTTGHQMLIYYSIGNYISAQSEQTSQKGGIASFTMTLTTSGYKVTDYKLTPLTIVAYGNGKYVPELQ